MRKLFFSVFMGSFLFACNNANNPPPEGCPEGTTLDSESGECIGTGPGEGQNNGKGAYAVMPGNQNTDRIREMYDTWMNTYYITYEDDMPNFPSQNQHSDAPGTARIKAVYGSRANNDSGYTCSEAMGYGMLLSSLMEDWERFDKLHAYTKLFHIPGTALMRWDIAYFGFPRTTGGSATDADLDILGALLIAYEKTKRQSYLDDALAIGASIYEWEVGANTKLILPARNTETWSNSGAFTRIGDENLFNISYFSLPVLRALTEYDNSIDWYSVLEANLSYMERVQNAWAGEGGLWPDWSNASGMPVNPTNGSNTTHAASDGSTLNSYEAYHRETPRIPWRIAWYYHWYGDPRAKAMLDNGMAFLRSRGVVNSGDAKSYYTFDGRETIYLNNQVMTWASLCALGMGNTGNQEWLNNCNERLLGAFTPRLNTYYASSLQLIYAMLFNGKY